MRRNEEFAIRRSIGFTLMRVKIYDVSELRIRG